MNRNNEWQEYSADMMKDVPASVEYCAQRAIARAKKRRFRLNLARIPAMSIFVLMLTFIVLVNTSVAFAKTMGEIPPLRELAKFVAGSPSLKAAVDNKYVQPLGYAVEHDGVVVNLAYAIADARRLSLFYSVSNPSSPKNRYSITEAALRDADGNYIPCTSASGGSSNGTLEELQFIFYGDETLPLQTTFTVRLIDLKTEDEWKSAPVQVSDTYEPPTSPDSMEPVWSFELSLDPELTLPGEKYELNQWITIEGQRLYFKEFVIYPTGAKLVIEQDASNTAVLQGIGLTLENEKKLVWEQVKNGISAAGGSEDSTLEYFMESSYFAKSKHLTLTTSRISLVPLESLHVTVDAEDRSVTNLPDYIRLDSMWEANGELYLRFEVDEAEEDHMFGPFSGIYTTADGETGYSSWSSSSHKDEKPGIFYHEFSVKGHEKGPIQLELTLAPLYDIDPILIQIR